ncbi:MAG: hypothetical protein OWQ54_07430 [Sulfolobaceae archaeon]|nr:hypothetical protein [Sulfolobaceae archaeon]
MSEENKEVKSPEDIKKEIKSLISIIPPASELKEKKKPPKEKRLKVRRKDEINKGFAIISEKLSKELEIKDEIEISVKGKRIQLKALVQQNVPELEVWVNSEDLKTLGIEDNSTVTVRAVMK